MRNSHPTKMMNASTISKALRNEINAQNTLAAAKEAYERESKRPQFVEGEIYTFAGVDTPTVDGITKHFPMLIFGFGEHAIRIPAYRVGALPRGIEDSVGRDFRCEKVLYDALGNKAFITFSPIN